ncbi:uncharacterized protein [Halyomorpha halys]|uniref:uncharacterized protein isoform X1 n=1 Tax=Halyomorpha halys TaxID=286706 RepID=UPI0006D4D083|nr:uncharacterized protein LOC106677230 isoform X1 [Halyomorpha halys]
MWKEEIIATKFPYAVNSKVEAENILFKNLPERLVLLKWVYSLTSGLLNDITPKELADYFFNLGVVEGDPLKFVEADMEINHQKKVWSNLFCCAKMIKCTQGISQNFVEKYCDQMPSFSTVSVEHLSISSKTLDPLSLESGNPNLDNIIPTLEEQVVKSLVSSSEENKIVLCKLKEYLKRLSLLNAQIRSPESTNAHKDQNEFGNYTADLYKKMQNLETVLVSSSNIMSSMRQLDENLDHHLLKSESTLELVSKLQRFNGDF